MANVIEMEESLDVVETMPLPQNLCNLFAYTPDTFTSSHKQFKDDNLQANTLSRLKQQRDDAQFCDVTFVAGVNCEKIIAHRNILAGASDYFAAMFTSKMREERETEIAMADVRADAMEAIVNYCYTSTIEITLDNVQAVYALAHLMQLNKIVNACSEFLIDALHPSNCLQLVGFAELMHDSALLVNGKSYLENHFDEVIEQPVFVHLNLDQLTFLLERNHLHLECEECRFNAVKNWVEHNASERRTHISTLISLVQLNWLRPEYLVNTVGDFLPDDPVHETLYMDALKSYLFTYNNGVTLKLRKPGEPARLQRVLVVGTNSSDLNNPFIECYHPESISCSLSHRLYDQREDFQIAVLEENLYVIGGRINKTRTNTVVCLNLRTGIWSRSVPMANPRVNFGVAVLDGCIYVIGGIDHCLHLISVERWKPTNTEWELVSAPNHIKTNPVVAVLDGRLYAVGGEKYFFPDCCETIECYNPRTDRWTVCRTLARNWMSVGVVAIGTHLYVMRKDVANAAARPKSYSIERDHPGTGSWTVLVNLSNTTANSIATCLLGERILIVSSYSNNGSHVNAVEEYDPNTNTVTALTSLRVPKVSVRLAVVPAEFT